MHFMYRICEYLQNFDISKCIASNLYHFRLILIQLKIFYIFSRHHAVEQLLQVGSEAAVKRMIWNCIRNIRRLWSSCAYDERRICSREICRLASKCSMLTSSLSSVPSKRAQIPPFDRVSNTPQSVTRLPRTMGIIKIDVLCSLQILGRHS